MKSFFAVLGFTLFLGCTACSTSDFEVTGPTPAASPSNRGSESSPVPAATSLPTAKSNEKVVDEVRQIAAKILGRTAEEINVQAPLSTRKADELDMLEIIMSLEETFNIEIKDEEILLDSKVENLPSLSVNRLAEIVLRKQKLEAEVGTRKPV